MPSPWWTYKHDEITWQRVLLHLVFWGLYVVANYMNVGVLGGRPHVMETILYTLPVDMAATYFTAYILLPRFLLKKNYLTFILLLLLSAIVFTLLERMIYYYIIYPTFWPNEVHYKAFFDFGFLFLLGLSIYTVVFLVCGVRLFKYYSENQQAKKELDKQRIQSELAMLRSQINPHFLFNTLNNIDMLVYKDQEKASSALVKLSGIMRYMLYESDTDRVPIQKEIDYLNNYIELLRLRFPSPDAIRFSIEGRPNSYRIPPMLLIPFLENAYKHGRKSGDWPVIDLKLKITEQEYRFFVTNPALTDAGASKDQSGGIGLQNVRRRLELMYKDNFTFEISRENGFFHTKLRIPHDH